MMESDSNIYIKVDESCQCPQESTDENKKSSFFSSFLGRIKRFDFLVVYLSLLILGILLILVIIFGEQTTWYRNLAKNNINPWLLRGLWLVATILSFVTFSIIWQDIKVNENPQDLILSSLFIVAGFLFVAWSVTFYYAENITLSLWILIVMFTYNFWLFLYVWYINPIAAIFLIPNLLLYSYLLYTTIHLASMNDIPI